MVTGKPRTGLSMKCPHCGADFPVWDEDHPLNLKYEDGAQTTFECEKCSKEFICVTEVKYLFSTATTEERADDSEWGPSDDPDKELPTADAVRGIFNP